MNLEALFAVSQAVAGPMREQGRGSVINVSSMFGSVASAPVPDAGYVASKSAVNGLTRELAAQWARRRRAGERDRAGLVPERDDRRAPRRTSARGAGSSASARWAGPGRVDELDGVLLFLASDASSYCTGQVITIDGGWTIR